LIKVEENRVCFYEITSLDEMYDFIISEWNDNGEWFSKEDVWVSDSIGNDARTEWKEYRYVGLKCMGMQIFEKPRCIGMCSIE
jgi:hypothetical protein